MEEKKNPNDKGKRIVAIVVIFSVLAAIFYGIIVAGQNLYDVFVK